MYLTVTNVTEDAEASQPALSAARDCVSMRKNRPSAWDIGDEKYAQYLKDWIEICQREAAADPSPPVQLSLYKALFAADRRPEAIVVLRALAATDNTEALTGIYEWHRSWERDDVNAKQTVGAKEAGGALRRAAELGDPTAIRTYATNLDQGSIIKRDVDAAAYWMEKS
jgi:TPR repeat protein